MVFPGVSAAGADTSVGGAAGLAVGAMTVAVHDRVYLSRATLVVVPAVLIGHWMQQVEVRSYGRDDSIFSLVTSCWILSTHLSGHRPFYYAYSFMVL